MVKVVMHFYKGCTSASVLPLTMLTLLSQAKFWTFRDEVAAKNSDFGAFRYHEKKDVTDSPYNESKRSYAEKRGMTWLPQNKRPNKLKDSLKELEDVIVHHKVVFCQWRDNCVVQLMMSSGLLINICVNVTTGDILRVMVDKFLVGKLLSEHIADVILTKTHLLCSYNDSQLTLVYFTKPAMKWNDKMSRLDPKVQTLELGGPSGRRLERKLSCNVGGDMILIWWRCTRDEVYPWSPLVKDQDRANVHVYSINGIKAELLCYYRTEFDPVCVLFSKVQANVIHSVEQKVTRKGEVTVESCTYEISKCRLQRTSVTSIPLQTQVCCHGFSPDEEKLLLGCIDGSLVLFDEGRGITHLVKAAFISTMVAWHPDGALVVVANERSQLQCYDVALACIKHQLLSEDVTPSNLLDLASYFRNQPTLIQMLWARKPDVVQHRAEGFAQTDALLLLHFERGPLAVLRLVAGGGMQGDIHGTGLTPDVLVTQYLSMNQVDRAINLLLSLNWDSYGLICLASLHRISNYLFRQPLTPEREVQLQTALGSFHVPLRPICHATEVEFGGQVRHLTRRFFHHLLRYRLFEKAFRLAIDLNDHDLFMDIYHYARYMNEDAMAEAAREKAEQILNHSSTGSSSDTGSHSSCSDCPSGDGTSSEAESEIPPQPPPPPPPPPLPRQQQKVKFSDTVTHILVPDLPPPLPEELPHSNKEYLKDLTTIPDVSEEEDNGNGTIKIVHFGVV